MKILVYLFILLTFVVACKNESPSNLQEPQKQHEFKLKVDSFQAITLNPNHYINIFDDVVPDYVLSDARCRQFYYPYEWNDNITTLLNVLYLIHSEKEDRVFMVFEYRYFQKKRKNISDIRLVVDDSIYSFNQNRIIGNDTMNVKGDNNNMLPYYYIYTGQTVSFNILSNMVKAKKLYFTILIDGVNENVPLTIEQKKSVVNLLWMKEINYRKKYEI